MSNFKNQMNVKLNEFTVLRTLLEKTISEIEDDFRKASDYNDKKSPLLTRCAELAGWIECCLQDEVFDRMIKLKDIVQNNVE